MADQPTVVVAEAYSESAMRRLHDAAHVVEVAGKDAAALRDAIENADALLVRTYVSVTDDLLSAAPRLRVVGRAGVGVDNIDVAAARRRGVVVVHTPAAATRSVAEHTVALMLALERKIQVGSQAVRNGDFRAAREKIRYRELGDLTLGIVGMGRIGSCVAGICAAGLGMRILYNDIADVGPFEFPARQCEKDELFATADVVTLHVPLTPLTRGLINAASLTGFKPTTTLINTARGAVVDLSALAAALNNGQLAGAALDVFDPEPPPLDHPILAAPNVVVTPHVASRSHAGLERMNDVVDDVIRVLNCESPQYPAINE